MHRKFDVWQAESMEQDDVGRTFYDESIAQT